MISEIRAIYKNDPAARGFEPILAHRELRYSRQNNQTKRPEGCHSRNSVKK